MKIRNRYIIMTYIVLASMLIRAEEVYSSDYLLIRSELIDELQAKCPAQFGSLEKAEVGKVIDAFKRFMDYIIGYYIEDDPNECMEDLAKAVKDFWSSKERVRIKIDFDQDRPVKGFPDGESSMGRLEHISVWADVLKSLPGLFENAKYEGPEGNRPKPTLDDPDAYLVAVEFIAELFRMKQELDDGVNSEIALKFMANVEILRKKLEIYEELKEELKKLQADPFYIYMPKFSINKQVLDLLSRNDDITERNLTIDGWLHFLCNLAISWTEKDLERAWGDFKRQFGIGRNVPIDQLDEQLGTILENHTQPIGFGDWEDESKQVGFFVVPQRWSGGTKNAPVYYGGGGTFRFGSETVTRGTNVITQVAGPNYNAVDLVVTNLDHIYHAAVVDDGATLFVLGGDNGSGDGYMIAYSDTDGDGYFEPGTATEAIQDLTIYGGACFVEDPGTGELLIYTRLFQELWSLEYSTPSPHEFPTYLDNRGTIGPARDDIHWVQISEDGLSMKGYGKDLDEPYDENTVIPTATASVAGGEFIPDSGTYRPYFDDDVEPLFESLPVHGDVTSYGFGVPAHTVAAHAVSGVVTNQLGASIAGTNRSVAIPLSRPLVGGEGLFLVDLDIGLSSEVQAVVPTNYPVIFTEFRNMTDGRIFLWADGRPGAAVVVDSLNADVEDWYETGTSVFDELGRYSTIHEPPPGASWELFRIRSE